MKSIIELARAAGCHDNGKEFRFVELRYLERFAALVRAQALEEAARLIEPSEEHRQDASCGYLGGTEGVELPDNCAAALRALKEKA